jgi:hypothetical protein
MSVITKTPLNIHQFYSNYQSICLHVKAFYQTGSKRQVYMDLNPREQRE